MGCPSSTLKPLSNLLQGDSDPTSPRTLTPEARQALVNFQEALSRSMLSQIDYRKESQLSVFPSQFAPTGLLWQDAPLYWVHLPASLRKIVAGYPSLILSILIKAEEIVKQYFGMRLQKIILPYIKEQLAY